MLQSPTFENLREAVLINAHKTFCYYLAVQTADKYALFICFTHLTIKYALKMSIGKYM